jgi:hypothetical protein
LENKMDNTLLAALLEVKVAMADPGSWNQNGICQNVHDRIEGYACEGLGRLATLMGRWPDCSGDVTFPVPSRTPCIGPSGAYMTATPANMWDRESSDYARMRWALLDWLIATLSDTALFS